MKPKNISLKKSSQVFKLIISKNLEEKIRFLCNKFVNREYSGVLFYTFKGSFQKNNIVLTGKDFLLMDIGNATFTEFENSEDIAHYMAMNPELLDCQLGLMH